jgi:hypothetical protein
MSRLLSVKLIKCPLSINVILAYRKPSIISSHFSTTVSLQTFTFGVLLSDITFEVSYLFFEIVILASDSSKTLLHDNAPSISNMSCCNCPL